MVSLLPRGVADRSNTDTSQIAGMAGLRRDGLPLLLRWPARNMGCAGQASCRAPDPAAPGASRLSGDPSGGKIGSERLLLASSTRPAAGASGWSWAGIAELPPGRLLVSSSALSPAGASGWCRAKMAEPPDKILASSSTPSPAGASGWCRAKMAELPPDGPCLPTSTLSPAGATVWSRATVAELPPERLSLRGLSSSASTSQVPAPSCEAIAMVLCSSPKARTPVTCREGDAGCVRCPAFVSTTTCLLSGELLGMICVCCLASVCLPSGELLGATPAAGGRLGIAGSGVSCCVGLFSASLKNCSAALGCTIG
mmetsp:Transcript_86120/g.196491  ORF Transcript_86120/g.196491 Transcript_86120/m.196491 type:complete len:312 (-) Transcript_86120:427-1362(-)